MGVYEGEGAGLCPARRDCYRYQRRRSGTRHAEKRAAMQLHGEDLPFERGMWLRIDTWAVYPMPARLLGDTSRSRCHCHMSLWPVSRKKVACLEGPGYSVR